MTTPTRDHKVARSFESYGTEFDTAGANSRLAGSPFTATDAQYAIEEVMERVLPALDPWDENDNGSITASNLNDWALKRFFHVSHKTEAIYNSDTSNTGGGDIAKGKVWNFHPVNNIVIDPVYFPDIGTPTIEGAIPATSLHYTGGFVRLPGPAVYKISAKASVRGPRSQIRIDIGSVSSIVEHFRGCVYTNDKSNNAAEITACIPAQSTINGTFVPAASNIIPVVLSSPLSALPVIGQPILIDSTNYQNSSVEDSIAYVTAVTDSSTFSIKTIHTFTASTSKNITIREILKHDLDLGNYIESCGYILPDSSNITNKTVNGLGKKISEIIQVVDDWFYKFRMNTSTDTGYWSNAVNMPGYATDNLYRLADSSFIRQLPKTIIFGYSTDPAGSVTGINTANGIAVLPDAFNDIYMWQYLNTDPSGSTDFGIDVPSGAPNMHGEIIFERIG